jgi:hypothetical protein
VRLIAPAVLLGMLVLAAPVLRGAGAQNADLPETQEVYRLRFVNRPGGSVEVSTDRGESWEELGKVTRPATAPAPGSAVLTAVPAGSVAGVGPTALLLRLPSAAGSNRVLRVLARGEPGNASALGTDIPERTSLFRILAPPIGSRIYLEPETGTARPLPGNYVPRPGDRLVIVAAGETEGDPPTVTIENREGGEVILAATGGVPRVLARVKQPLRGIGRYAGTERAGSGRVVAWSPTAITVATAGLSRRGGRARDEGAATEERGGFVIQPAEPPLQGATHAASQVLLEAVAEGETRPPVSRLFGLAGSLSSGDPLDPTPTRVEVRLDEGDWEPFPDLRGAINAENMLAALQAAVGSERPLKEGITHLRLSFGALTADQVRRRVLLATTPLAPAPQRGVARIAADVMGDGVAYVVFLLNGRQAKVSNVPPFEWMWDTRRVPNGEHLIEIRGLDNRNATVTSVVTRVLVDN